jgi:hypothetical protein
MENPDIEGNNDGVKIRTPSVKRLDFDKTEVQDQINELNLITETEFSEKGNDDEVENLNEILMSTVKKDYQKIKETKRESKENVKLDNPKFVENKKISEFEVINQDIYLQPFEGKIKERVEKFKQVLKDIETNEGDFFEFCRSYKKMGLQVTKEGIKFTEYAPAARALSIVQYVNFSSVILITGIGMNITAIKIALAFGPL